MADVIARKATPVQNVNVVIVVIMVTLIVKACNIDCYALSKLAYIVAEGNIVSCQCFVMFPSGRKLGNILWEVSHALMLNQENSVSRARNMWGH